MRSDYLITHRTNGMWDVVDRIQLLPIAGSPFPTEAAVEAGISNADACRATVRASVEATRRKLGRHYDPAD